MALPRPDPRLEPTQDEFDEWCLHPVTRWIAAAHDQMVQEVQKQWIEESWTNHTAQDAEMLLRRRQSLFARADAYAAFLQTEWSRYRDVLAGADARMEHAHRPKHPNQTLKAKGGPARLAN